ncbi:uncharacterized protein MELLADRAFT_104573 [Melampsora larici-populina 98AG31]|uniref:BRCT domain-containing protein n=1 Tax=Melampsora larici-populina (strain 98AG31 / pathotype 3-4-7) TaxID=747676 RepID=F4RF61_MELLP|nr:uncharacterized protein MELLADRAFT_104573 [Melampsora larici-populina 98AG31]EGG08992.1 hypothetical protein MELLADRAFT_104573 [Melampsora larici-populina 98AG31]
MVIQSDNTHPTQHYYPLDPSEILARLTIALDSSTELPPGDLMIMKSTVTAWGGQFTKDRLQIQNEEGSENCLAQLTQQGRQDKNRMNNNTLTALTNKIHPKVNGKQVYLVTPLEMSLPSHKMFVRSLKRMGADFSDAQAEDPSWKGDHDASNTVLRTALSAADFVICDSCSGLKFWLAWELEKLFDYPLPPGMLPGWDPSKNVVSITNHTVFSWTWLIPLIDTMGLKYSGSFERSASLLLAANQSGKKVECASELGIPTINYLYLKDFFWSWSKLEVKSIHTSYPKDGDLLQPTYKAGYTIETIQRWSQTSAAKEARKTVLQGYHWSCNITPKDKKVTIRDKLDHINLDEIPQPKPLSNLAMSEKPVPENNTKLKRQLFMTHLTTRVGTNDLAPYRQVLPQERPQRVLTSLKKKTETYQPHLLPPNQGLLTLLKACLTPIRALVLMANLFLVLLNQPIAPAEVLKWFLDHLSNEKSSNKQDRDASRNHELPDKINAEDLSLDDITKSNASKAMADAPKLVNGKDTSNGSCTSHTKKVPQRPLSDTPNQARSASQAIRRALTQTTAKNTTAKVADCAADML